MKLQARLAAVAVLLGFVALAYGQPSLPPRTKRAIDAIAEQALRQVPIAGISIAIARGSTTLMAAGYGYADLKNNVSASADTVYHVDSVTKNLTAVAILHLSEEGKINLDDPIDKYIPEFPTQNHRVLIRHLLSHTSGIANFTGVGAKFDAIERIDSSHAAILRLVQDEPFHFAPGTGWRYSNTGFYLLGMIIERVTGQSYGDYLDSQLVKPLKLSSTRYCNSDVIIAQPAPGYVPDAHGLKRAGVISWVNAYSAGAVCSTVLDLLNYQHSLNSGRIVTNASLSLMRSPTRLIDGILIDYGMGTRIGDLTGHRVVGHTGSGAGYNSVLEYFPDDDLTIAVLMNTDGHLSAPIIAAQVAQLVLKIPKTERANRQISTKRLSAYVGTFESEDQVVVLFVKKGKLWAKPSGDSGGGSPAEYVADDTFSASSYMRVKFLRSAGEVRWMSIYIGGLLMDVCQRIRSDQR